MNPVRAVLTLAAAVATGLATSQSLGAAGDLTLNGSLVSGGVGTFDVARRVLITSAGDDSGLTWLIVGTDRNDNPQSESLAGGDAAAVFTLLDFLTVISIHGSAATASTVTAGTNAVGSTPWILREWGQIGKMGVLISIPAPGPTVQLEVTWDDVNAALEVYPYGASVEPTSAVPPLAVVAPASEAIFQVSGSDAGQALATQSWADITATTGGAAGAFDVPVFAMRMTQTATSAASASSVLYIIESTTDRKDAF